MKRLKGAYVFAVVFFSLCLSNTMCAQFIDPQTGKGIVIPEDLDYCTSMNALVNARDWKKLTPEQIEYLGEYGFDTTNYHAKCKQLRLVSNLSLVGLLSSGLGGIGLIAWTDHDEDGNAVYNTGRVIAGGFVLCMCVGGMIGLDIYLKKEVSNLIDQAEKARIRIGATDSGIGLSLRI